MHKLKFVLISELFSYTSPFIRLFKSKIISELLTSVRHTRNCSHIVVQWYHSEIWKLLHIFHLEGRFFNLDFAILLSELYLNFEFDSLPNRNQVKKSSCIFQLLMLLHFFLSLLLMMLLLLLQNLLQNFSAAAEFAVEY